MAGHSGYEFFTTKREASADPRSSLMPGTPRYRQRSEVRGYAYKRSHLVALRASKISASDPPSTWWPGER